MKDRVTVWRLNQWCLLLLFPKDLRTKGSAFMGCQKRCAEMLRNLNGRPFVRSDRSALSLAANWSLLRKPCIFLRNPANPFLIAVG